MDWVPRSVHTKARKVKAVMQEIEQRRGRPATEREMVKALRISVREYNQWLEDIRPATFICLDAASSSEGDDAMSQYDSLPDHRQESPADGAFRRELAPLLPPRLNPLPRLHPKLPTLYSF